MTLKKEIHRPFKYENKNSNTIIIFIHGILESPNQFKEFAKISKKENFSYSAILLDGHGKSGKDFAKSNKDKWIKNVDAEILKYKKSYENIILVGHSMGGLLSVLFSLKYKKEVKGLVLIGTPLKVFVRYNIIRSSFKVVFRKIHKKDVLAQQALRAFSVDRCSIFTYITWIPRYIDLFILIKKAKKQLGKVSVPTLIIQSKDDEFVSCKSLNVFRNELNNDYKIVNLEKSGHFHYEKGELKYLLQEFKNFIKEI